MSKSPLTCVYHHIVLLITLVSCFGPLQTSAQSTASTSSPSSSTFAASPQSTIIISGLPSLLNLPYLNSTNPTIQIELPTTSPIFITLNICSVGTNVSLLPTVLLSTASPPVFSLGTRSVVDRESGGLAVPNKRNRAGYTWQLEWDAGFANWTWSGTEAGVSMLIGIGSSTAGSVDSNAAGDGNIAVQLGIAGNVPSHSLYPVAPLLGDTTANSAFLFSPLLLSSPHPQPSYPNYTLPPIQLIPPNYPGTANLSSLSAGSSLLLVPTTSSPTMDGLDNSLCAVRSASTSTGALADPSHMLLNATPSWVDVGGEEGFRKFWVVGDLLAETNYTAWIVDEDGGMSAPIWLATKEASFPCQLVVPTSLCPSIAYAAPLLPNTTSSTDYPITSLPTNITSLITNSLQSFSTSLLSSACGRDLYSHVSSCADCFAAYRDWLCRVVIPQCAPSSPSSSSSPTAQSIFRTPSAPRNPSMIPEVSYDEMLPCLSVCNAVDRACPVSLGFRCPIRGITANASYAYIGDEAGQGDGSAVLGQPALDRWGNRWCNG